jgi:methyl-accepting chemotaxis protein
MTSNIGQIVTRLQFQDLAKQHFEHIIDGMMLIKSGLAQLDAATSAAGPASSTPPPDRSAWLEGLVSGLPVGTTRQRFLRALLLGGTALDGIGALDALSEVAADAGGSGADEDTIELF